MPENLPERYEVGTLNISGIAGLNVALKWIKNQTIAKLFQAENKNRQTLLKILSDYDFISVVGNVDSREYVGIVSCFWEGIISDSAGKIFAERGIAIRAGL